ncbi:uncharacterized protein LOC129300241 [Prosopis cineraria]|uniref:uncharacterized protein LOC129300241 n=1 Tax=Prosopis cineraria TaxID=364024 RepID=UPI0024108790|nr:uncharacterized protein LOC129300241 [Prosopis cineraria]
MSNPSRSFGASDKHQRVGPDYFGYYAHEVVNLLSRDDNDLQSSKKTSKPPQNSSGQDSGKSTEEHRVSSGSLNSDDSDFKKERLTSLLRQSVTDLSSEVNEMLEPVLAMRRLQSRLKGEKHSSGHAVAVPDDDAVQIPSKKRKGDDNQLGPNTSPEEKNEEVNVDLHFLLENDRVQVEEIVKKHADQLSGRLGYMEQQLELLLDAVTSTCRPMTLDEKQQLQKLIQKLPPRNLDRVVEIISQSKPVEQPCDQLLVDLEKEDNITLWRLHYYVKAVERARTLSCSQRLD